MTKQKKMQIKKLKGLTLIELMVSIAIGLFLVAVVVSIFINNKKAYQSNNDFVEMSDNVRFAVTMINNDLTNAGFYGSISYKDEITISDFSPANDCGGFAAGGSNSSIKRSIAGGNTLLNCLAFMDTASDWISIKRVLSNPVDDVSLVNATSYLRTGKSNGLLASGTKIAGLSDAQLPGGSSNMNFLYKHHIYYVEANTSAEPSNRLIRKSIVDGQWVSKVLVGPGSINSAGGGIERIKFMYGEDTDATLDGVANFFLNAGDVTNWNNVVSVKVYILARTAEDKAGLADTKTYALGDTTYTPGGKYHRKLFTSTVFLRNNWYILTGGI